LRDPRRPLALLLLSLAFAACGGGNAEEPDTQVVIPEQTPAPTATATEFEIVDGFLTYADNERVRLLESDGREHTYWVPPEYFQEIGIPHLASHVGLTDLGFRVAFESKRGRKWIRGSEEIPPPFAFPSTEGGE